MLHINDALLYDEPNVPFGGVKAIGVGHVGGKVAIELFTKTQWISIGQTTKQYPI